MRKAGIQVHVKHERAVTYRAADVERRSSGASTELELELRDRDERGVLHLFGVELARDDQPLHNVVFDQLVQDFLNVTGRQAHHGTEVLVGDVAAVWPLGFTGDASVNAGQVRRGALDVQGGHDFHELVEVLVREGHSLREQCSVSIAIDGLIMCWYASCY